MGESGETSRASSTAAAETAPPGAAGPAAVERPVASLADYVSMARPDHWVKHVFILPGIGLALLLLGAPEAGLVRPILVGLASAALVASSNYVLNEWLDAAYDAYHPRKRLRPAVHKRLSALLVWLEYAALLVTGLLLAWSVGRLYAAVTGLFWLSGVLYNVAPLRTKELPFLDVLTESANNPIRLTLGWAMVDGGTLPPSSVLLAFWMGGAFLMAVKRFAEYRAVVAEAGREALVRYRRSFAGYSQSSLLVSAFVYALMTAFFLAVFLVKYRIEYLLLMPLIAGLFGLYLYIGLRPESAAESPERLFRERGLIVLVVAIVLALAVLTWIDLPVLERLSDPHYIVLPSGWR